MKIKLLPLIAAFFALTISVKAENVKPVMWSAEINLSASGEGQIVFKSKIASGWHIYSEKTAGEVGVPTSFDYARIAGAELIGEIIPSVKPIDKVDNGFNLSWWDKDVTFVQKFRLLEGSHSVAISGIIRYMACQDNTCTPPADFSFELTDALDGYSAAEEWPAKAEETNNYSENVISMAESNKATTDSSKWWTPVKFNETTEQSTWWYILLWGFIGGLLALLTPCVWPMIPLTVSFFLKKNNSRKRSIMDAAIYGGAILVIYLALGLAVTLIFGASKLNDLATNAVFNLIFFALLVVFAISFFGAFEIKLPSRWSNKMDSKAERTTGLISIFFMAFTLVLVSFSCTGPLIGTLLVEAASNGDIAGPALGMGAFALALAIPFTLFAIFPSMLKEMPRSGGWLNSVKVVLGFLELVLSLKFLSVVDLAYGWGILDREVFLALWIVLFVLLGLYLIGKLQFSHDAPLQYVSIPRFFLALASFSFAVYLLPGLWGAPLRGVSAFAPPLYTQDFNLYSSNEAKHFDNYDEGMQYAAENHKPVLVDFSGLACVNCRKMEAKVFDNPEVRKMIANNFVMITLMVDDKQELSQPIIVKNGDETIELKTIGARWSYLQSYKFGAATQPFYVMLDNDGNLLGDKSYSYDENIEAFMEWLSDGISDYKKQ